MPSWNVHLLIVSIGSLHLAQGMLRTGQYGEGFRLQRIGAPVLQHRLRKLPGLQQHTSRCLLNPPFF